MSELVAHDKRSLFVIRSERTDVFQMRQSSLEAYLPLLDAMWNAGCRNGAELWRRVKAKGFRGALRVVSEWATRRRRAERASHQSLQKVPSARRIARPMTTARDRLSKADTVLMAAIEVAVSMLGRQIVELDGKVRRLTKASEPVRRLMTAPGVGPITALCFLATIDDPTRFG